MDAIGLTFIGLFLILAAAAAGSLVVWGLISDRRCRAELSTHCQHRPSDACVLRAGTRGIRIHDPTTV